jgi:hypothetical protein
MDRGPCRSCGAMVIWTRTAATRKPMPLDESPEHGNVLIDDMSRAHVFRDHDTAAAELARDPERYSALTYFPHHASCARGEDWRGKRRGDADAPRPGPPQGSLL